MYKFIALFLLQISMGVIADECPSSYKDKLVLMLSTTGLGEHDEKGKLEKFTHHDYPMGCEIFLNERKYEWFTDKAGNRFLIKETLESQVKYYGLFKNKNT